MLSTAYFFVPPKFHNDTQNEVGSQILAKYISEIDKPEILWCGVDMLFHCATLLYRDDDDDDGMGPK